MAEKTPLRLNQIVGVVGEKDYGRPVAVYVEDYNTVPRTWPYLSGGKLVTGETTALIKEYRLVPLTEAGLVDFEIDERPTDLRNKEEQLPEVSVTSIVGAKSGGPGITGRYYAIRRQRT